MEQCAHFNRGKLKVAFVFSVPGTKERDASRPVVGDTGENLEMALESLTRSLKEVFGSSDRYDYRITNSFDEPHSKIIGTSRSEARASQVLSPSNVKRVIEELEGCEWAILCGRRAQLLSTQISAAGIKVVPAWHTGNRALASKFKGDQVASAPTPSERRRARARLWAEDLRTKLDHVRSVPGSDAGSSFPVAGSLGAQLA